jgi:hypothetical protein
MSSNRFALIALVSTLLFGWSTLASAASICPLRHGNPLKFVDIFDGSPEEQATLVPDRNGASSGYWDLAYVFEAGRTVGVRCKYRNGETRDGTIRRKVKRCDYRIDSAKNLFLDCR